MVCAAISPNRTMNGFSLCFAVLLLVSCAGTSRKSEWDNLDYSSVYRKAGENKEYDTNYTPSFNSCVDNEFVHCE